MPSVARGSSSDILSIYTHDVARYRMLTPDEEREIGFRAMAGDEDAQDELVVRNLRFVISYAKRYRHHGVAIMDLIQAGNIGLAHAARRFNPSMGVRFISYASFWISQALQKEIDGSHGSVRATQTQMVRLRRIRRLQAQAKQRLGRELSVQELASETGYTKDRIEEALGYRVTMKSLDEPVNPSDGTTTTLGQVIGAEDGRDEADDEAERQTVVQQFMQQYLLPREIQVLQEYYGFFGKREMSLTEIGAMRGISRERARQLKERGLKKLRAAVGANPEMVKLLKSVFTTQADLEARRPGDAAAPVEPGRPDRRRDDDEAEDPRFAPRAEEEDDEDLNEAELEDPFLAAQAALRSPGAITLDDADATPEALEEAAALAEEVLAEFGVATTTARAGRRRAVKRAT